METKDRPSTGSRPASGVIPSKSGSTQQKFPDPSLFLPVVEELYAWARERNKKEMEDLAREEQKIRADFAGDAARMKMELYELGQKREMVTGGQAKKFSRSIEDLRAFLTQVGPLRKLKEEMDQRKAHLDEVAATQEQQARHIVQKEKDLSEGREEVNALIRDNTDLKKELQEKMKGADFQKRQKDLDEKEEELAQREEAYKQGAQELEKGREEVEKSLASIQDRVAKVEQEKEQIEEGREKLRADRESLENEKASLFESVKQEFGEHIEGLFRNFLAGFLGGATGRPASPPPPPGRKKEQTKRHRRPEPPPPRRTGDTMIRMPGMEETDPLD